ncbi:unnamed protein product [Nippostrongylus brasiliensis]|uniref:DET1- and DDB1-associated protein 1 n=1 Tax=Nippostrongylus brasiliensis TaxID=27835 RepID=A0A0N4YVH0_NIPBR|nr:unnamed protein product [Nippostrongylus brasiliensis]
MNSKDRSSLQNFRRNFPRLPEEPSPGAYHNLVRNETKVAMTSKRIRAIDECGNFRRDQQYTGANAASERAAPLAATTRCNAWVPEPRVHRRRHSNSSSTKQAEGLL